MTEITEFALMLVRTLETFKGKSSKWLHENVDWLKTRSTYGIDCVLQIAENRGWVISAADKDRETLLYYPTRKGIKEYYKYNPK